MANVATDTGGAMLDKCNIEGQSRNPVKIELSMPITVFCVGCCRALPCSASLANT